MITLRTPLQTPTSTISKIEIREVRRTYKSANGQGDDAWTIVALIGGVGVPFCVKSQPQVTRVKRDENGKTVNDGNGAIVHETVDAPDVFDRLVADGGEVRTELVESEGALNLFQECVEGGHFDEAIGQAMIELEMIPAALNPA